MATLLLIFWEFQETQCQILVSKTVQYHPGRGGYIFNPKSAQSEIVFISYFTILLRKFRFQYGFLMFRPVLNIQCLLAARPWRFPVNQAVVERLFSISVIVLDDSYLGDRKLRPSRCFLSWCGHERHLRGNCHYLVQMTVSLQVRMCIILVLFYTAYDSQLNKNKVSWSKFYLFKAQDTSKLYRKIIPNRVICYFWYLCYNSQQ